MKHLLKAVEEIKGDALSQIDIDNLKLAFQNQIEVDKITDEDKNKLLQLEISSKKALAKAIEALWFHDSSDYYNYLCEIVKTIMDPLHPDNYEISRGKINSWYEYLNEPLDVTSS